MPHILTLDTVELIELEVLIKKEYEFYTKDKELFKGTPMAELYDKEADMLAALLKKIKEAK